MTRLSESLRLQREDGGVKSALLHRGDIFFRAWSRPGAPAAGRPTTSRTHGLTVVRCPLLPPARLPGRWSQRSTVGTTARGETEQDE